MTRIGDEGGHPIRLQREQNATLLLATASHPTQGWQPLPLCPWHLPSLKDSRLPTVAVRGEERSPGRRISKTHNWSSAPSTWLSKIDAWLSSGLVAFCRKIQPIIVTPSNFIIEPSYQAYFPEAESQCMRQVQRNKLVCYFPDLQNSQNRCWLVGWGGGGGGGGTQKTHREHSPHLLSTPMSHVPRRAITIYFYVFLLLKKVDIFYIRRNFRKKNLLNCMFPSFEETPRNGERHSLQTRCPTPAGKTRINEFLNNDFKNNFEQLF